VKLEQFPPDLQPYLLPAPGGALAYRCLGCERNFAIDRLLYTCPQCGEVLLIVDQAFERLKRLPPETWRRLFDYRKMLPQASLRGIYRYHEFIGPVLPLEHVVYLGEGHTPMIAASGVLQEFVGMSFHLMASGRLRDVLAVCASTGDTSAAAALYAAYLQPRIKSAVLLPHGKVTPQQLSQPLGSGARVFEIPGVFDDCMKVVEHLSEHFPVALLNSKNAWRILGQESYSYEIAQDFEYDLADKVIVVPIGNAGNITAILNGFLKFRAIGIITELPKIIGVQSRHANPVYRYYRQPEGSRHAFTPVNVQPSVAQAAMIGNPVSMPRVIHLVERYNQQSGRSNVYFVDVREQEIMDWQLIANRHGHIACTHGGECLAGLMAARQAGHIRTNEVAVLDSTAHALKFSGFQDMYFQNRFPDEYEVVPKAELMNAPALIRPDSLEAVPEPGRPLSGEPLERFVRQTASAIAVALGLETPRQA
jgi:threonine synthase